MFGTLVIVLPSLFAGGELLVRHKGREVRLDLHRADPNEAGFAAFYADCVHEVLPVTEGSRLALAYNLARPGRGKPPQPPGYEREQVSLAALLQSWRDGTYPPDEAVPNKLIYLLEHAYTPAELGFSALKGVDAAVAGVLAAAAEQARCDLHLALLTVEESGAAEYTGNHRRRGRWDDDEDDNDEFEAGELFDRSVSLSEWCRRNGEARISGVIPAEDDEFTPPAALAELAPDEEHFHEATGNEGATFERTYRRAALVLWPADRRLAVLSQGGLEATLPWLEDVVRRWSEGNASLQAELAAEAHALAGHITASWPSDRYHGRDKTPSDAARLLGLLTRLADTTAIAGFLQTVIATGRRDDNAAIVAALETLPPAQATKLVGRIVAGTAAGAPEACANLLARLAASWPRKRRGDLAGAASRLVATLPTKPTARPADDPWQAPRPALTPAFLRDLLTGLDAIDLALAGRAIEHVLAWPATYGPDSIVLPALRDWPPRVPCPPRRQQLACARPHSGICGRASPNRLRPPPIGGGRARCPAAARTARRWPATLTTRNGKAGS